MEVLSMIAETVKGADGVGLLCARGKVHDGMVPPAGAWDRTLEVVVDVANCEGAMV